MKQLVVLTGSNLGDKKNLLLKAENELSYFFGSPKKKSPLVKSEPWGFDHPEFFLNQVLVFETSLSPEECLASCLEVEKKLGRIRNAGKDYTARLIDVDILFYDSLVVSSENLVLPHPKMHERMFTLFPLAIVVPELYHPVFKMSVSELLLNCEDKSVVEVYD